MVNPSGNHPQQQYRLQFLNQLIHRYPFAVLSGLWLTLILMSGIAGLGLLNPGSLEQEESTPTPTQETIQQPVAIPKQQTIQQFIEKSTVSTEKTKSPASTETASTEKDGLPLSLFIAIAVGCALGSLLLTQFLKASTQPRHPSGSSKPAVPVGKKRPHPSKKRRPIPKNPQPTGLTKPTLQTVDNGLRRTNDQSTQITVLPPEESHPLDGREESLADMMDLRKRQSLASLMRSSK
jgi:hypothetical protein